MPTATTSALGPDGTAYTVNLWIAGLLYSPYLDITSLRVEESGTQEQVTASFTLVDKDNSLRLPDEGFVHIQHGGETIFKGFTRSRRPRIVALGKIAEITCNDIGSLLDTTLVVSNIRKTDESDKARLLYLLATYGSQGIWNAGIGSTDPSKIQVLKGAMPNQKFKNMTLRQAIESVLGLASESSNYYLDASGRLHTFDNSNPESDSAPYSVKVAHALGATEIAPEDLVIDFDTSSLINDYQVRAGVRAAGVRVADEYSMNRYGRRAAYIDAPDADTSAKATLVGMAALRDTADPIPRGSFTVQDTYVTRAGIRWMAGQSVPITSALHDMSAISQRIVRVSTEYLDGTGRRKQQIEFGGLRLRLRTGGSGNVSGSAVQGDIG